MRKIKGKATSIAIFVMTLLIVIVFVFGDKIREKLGIEKNEEVGMAIVTERVTINNIVRISIEDDHFIFSIQEPGSLEIQTRTLEISKISKVKVDFDVPVENEMWAVVRKLRDNLILEIHLHTRP